jgi:hypothetical protein
MISWGIKAEPFEMWGKLVRRDPFSASLHRPPEEGKRGEEKTGAIHVISQSFHNIVYPYSQ